MPFAGQEAVAASRDGALMNSAVSASSYAVPQRFLWLADFLMQGVALALAPAVAPFFQHWVWAKRAMNAAWVSWLSLAPAAAAAPPRAFSELLWIPLVMMPTTLLFMQLAGGYRPLLAQSRTRVVFSSFLAPVAGVSLVTLVMIAVRDQRTSRALIFSFTLLIALGFVAHRAAIRVYKRRRLVAGHYARNVVVVAPPDARRSLAAHFSENVAPCFYRLRGYLALPGELDYAGEDHALERLGAVSELGHLMVHQPIHEVIAVESPGAGEWLPVVIEQCEYFRATLRLVPAALLSWNSTELQVLFGRDPLRLPQIVLRPRYLDDEALFVKRVFDILVSGVLLAVLSPIFLLIALAIKLTTPQLPVLYPWRVVGYKGRTFIGYKFTTMQADADERKMELEHLNEMTGPVFKIKEDPRVTPLGKWLRKFSLNELPQLWSVLKGDMSLVGPRPAYPNELARYELWHKRKLCVQPGITCLWQIRGRNKIRNFDDWVRMDFEYIDNWSLWLDCRILIRTIRAVILGTGS